jgi:glutathione synthase/RimK-type ligase-like ATP-grasp enzyme
MTQSPFNQQVRSFTYDSRKGRGESEEVMAKTIAQELGLTDYGFYSWDMKHDNHGFLVCEKDSTPNCEHAADDVIVDGLCLLSFCPIY